MIIGVFDSGVGGKRVAWKIQAAMPEHQVIYRDDHDHVPYGLRTPVEIYNLIRPIFQQMIGDGCQLIVVACNTVSTNLIDQLRQNFSVPLIAVEPMVKPAVKLTKNKVIAVCATPATLSSNRYEELKKQYAKHVKVLEPDCSDWALKIEQEQVNELQLEQRIEEVLAQSADVIVLGCTHYHWIEEEIKKSAKDRAIVLQPEEAIIRQLKKVLAQLP